MLRKKSKTPIIIILLALYCILNTTVCANIDVPVSDDSTKIAAPDTVKLSPEIYKSHADSQLVSIYLSENDKPLPKPSATTTMLKSVAFPGWGQMVNKRYLKAGIIFTIESYFIYKAIDFGIKANDAITMFLSLSHKIDKLNFGPEVIKIATGTIEIDIQFCRHYSRNIIVSKCKSRK